MTRTTRFALPAAAAGVLALALAGCGGSTPTDGPAATQTHNLTATTAPAAGLTVTDPWAKAVPDIAASTMTGVFGKITNASSAPVTIVSATNSVSDLTELHETVDKDGQKTMRKVDGGFTIEPGATRELKPGSDHVMVMNMTKPLNTGDTVTITLTTQDGEKVDFSAVAKPFTGASEPYANGHGGMAPSGSPAPTMSH